MVSEAGVARATFYQHFASKDEVGVSVLVRSITDARKRLEALADSLPPGEVLRTMIEWVLDQHFTSDTYHDPGSTSYLFAHEPLRNAEKEIAHDMAALVAWGREEGTIRMGASPMIIAQTLHSILKDRSYEEDFHRGQLHPDLQGRSN